MQKLLTIFALSALLLQLPESSALSASTVPKLHPFGDDLAAFDSEMAELSALENLVVETQTTQSRLLEIQHPLIKHLTPGGDLASTLFGATAPDGELLMDIPGFLWGFCCSFVGVFLVYLSIDDPVARKKEGMQAIIGCATGTVLWVGLYIWFVIMLQYSTQ